MDKTIDRDLTVHDLICELLARRYPPDTKVYVAARDDDGLERHARPLMRSVNYVGGVVARSSS
jgi:hypothetical protein